jgi:GT2 family glycosyltransferase
MSFRARLAGWGIVYVPEAVAHHHVSATSSKLGNFTRYHAAKNIVMTYVKNMPGWLFWLYLPLFVIWMLRLAITNTLKGGGWAYAQGIVRAFLNFPALIKERHKIQSKRKVRPSEINALLYKSSPPRIPTVPAN